MIVYLIKTIACSAVFLLVYIIWLQPEKMHRFNRFYLLGSLAFSFLVPLFSIKITRSVPVVTNVNQVRDETITILNNATVELTRTQSAAFPWYTLLVIMYLGVSAFLIIRFTRNIIKLYSRIRKYRSVKYEGARLVLLPWTSVPHSFFNYIFLTEENYHKGTIQKEIWQHELTHVKQYHSVDIIITELLKIFLWFNPLIILYQKMIRVNHEFLADECVIKNGADAKAYQYLLVRPQHSMAGTFPASAFNYAITKKRLLMISKKTSPVRAWAKQIAVIVPASGLFLLCCIKTVAQDTPPSQVVPVLQVPSTKEGVSEELFAEYKTLTEKIINEKSKDKWREVSEKDMSRLQTIFVSMSKEQQGQQTIRFAKRPEPMARTSKTFLSAEKIDAWKNARMFGVWINEKRVENSVLNNYNPSDFAHVFVSKLSKNAINYGKHYYQIDLMTNEHYETYRKETLAQIKKNPLMMIVAWWKEKQK